MTDITICCRRGRSVCRPVELKTSCAIAFSSYECDSCFTEGVHIQDGEQEPDTSIKMQSWVVNFGCRLRLYAAKDFQNLQDTSYNGYYSPYYDVLGTWEDKGSRSYIPTRSYKCDCTDGNRNDGSCFSPYVA